jgi:hypothetical protein
MPRVAASSILTIRSPDLMPALNAGVSSIGETTRMTAVLDAHFDAEPAEAALRVDLQLVESLGVEEVGVRVEPAHHPVDRLLDELVVGDLLDVIALDLAEDRRQQLQVLIRDRQPRFALREHREVEAQQQAEHRTHADPSRLLHAVAHHLPRLTVSRRTRRNSTGGGDGLP